jgi:(2Fe-2S) ferredoxin
VTEHLVGGRPVERLRIAEECINSKSCPHRS